MGKAAAPLSHSLAAAAGGCPRVRPLQRWRVPRLVHGSEPPAPSAAQQAVLNRILCEPRVPNPLYAEASSRQAGPCEAGGPGLPPSTPDAAHAPSSAPAISMAAITARMHDAIMGHAEAAWVVGSHTDMRCRSRCKRCCTMDTYLSPPCTLTPNSHPPSRSHSRPHCMHTAAPHTRPLSINLLAAWPA
jgi:hypothetical protein